MRLPSLLFGIACLVDFSIGLPQDQNHLVKRAARPQRAAAVKEAFQHAWTGYYNYAFPNDELHPVSNGFGNSRNGWGASAVDALSTALVMQDKDIVNTIVNFIPSIDFSVSINNEAVSLFETTIRYLGGMLSAYDFLTGPLADLATNKANVASLLVQSQRLADLLSFAFDTHSGVPSNNLYFKTNTTDGSKTNGIATIGTLVLEWTHLSDLTGVPKYGKMAQKGESYLLKPQPKSREPFPGLLGTNVGLYAGRFRDDSGGWVGGDDSYYEYLIKMYVYDPSRFGHYKDRWVKAVESSMAHLASHPSTRPDLTYLAEFQGRKQIKESQHLACFDGGNFILGGTVLKRQDIVKFGLKLVEGCHNTYISTATKIGPEIFSWNASAVPATQLAFYKKHGFYITDSVYDLRPEVIESYYYAFQATGDSKYQDWAWDAFKAINATCRTGSGFAALKDVNAVGGGGKIDNQESFLFAEVMKYSYLIQSAEQPWDYNAGGTNQWVYNTEAHPFLVAGTPI